MKHVVELLATYSHSAHGGDLPLRAKVALTWPSHSPELSARRPWRLRDRLNERDITDLLTAYRDGATAASLAAAYGLNVKSVKRLLRSADVRRTPPTRQSAKATPAATHP